MLEAADRIESLQAECVVQSNEASKVQAKNRELHAEIDRLTAQCRLFDAAAYKAKVEARTLVEHAEARITALEGQEPVAWIDAFANVRSDLSVSEYSNIGLSPLFLAAGAAPQQAEPVQPERAPLNDAEIDHILKPYQGVPEEDMDYYKLVRSVETYIKQAEPKEQT